MDDGALLAATLERLLDDHADHADHDALWRALDVGGFSRVGIAEAVGGAGGGVRDAHVVVDRLALAGASVPVAETILAGWLCQRARVALPGGPVTVAPTVPGDEVVADAFGRGWRVRGRATRVPWARDCGHVVVVAPRPSSATAAVVAVVPRSAARIAPGANLAGEA